jgi:hypothetical protein
MPQGTPPMQPHQAATKDYMGGNQGLVQEDSGAKTGECSGA